ncbi:T-cell-specific surface glycoprotein CD28-like [Coregonus clupeaformis]|uniref:T-cell-specific surface glycoprotein CD28-like n=1 Tax=Coregonus clupeaformis TaxID=59861 RepID=UPI001E1C8E62|nr:T-cell-specific surface glycoprotein CD28-like [Coregonus clupeaformis]
MERNFWITAILLSLCLSDRVLSEHSQLPNCKDRPLSIQRVSLQSRVSISCPNMSGEELRFHLSVNQCLVHTTLLQKNQSHTRTNQPDTWAQFFLVDQNLNQNLTNRYVFTVNSTGVYTCRAERMWSPPYQEDSVHTLLIEEKQCLTHRDPLANQDQDLLANQNCTEVPKHLPLCPLLVGCGALYSIIITIITIVIWRKLKKEVSERSDYVNIKPGEKTGPKRIQHPVTRRF